MSSSISSLGTAAAQGESTVAAAPVVAAAFAPVSFAPAGDAVILSQEAQNYLQALNVLSSFETLSTAGSLQAGYSGKYGSASVSIQAGGPGASAGFSVTSFDGEHIIDAQAQGSSTGNDVIDMAVFSDGAPNDHALGQIKLGSGNDTVSAYTNGDVAIGPGNGNDYISTDTTGLGIATVGLGSGSDTVNIYGGGFAYGGSGVDVINLYDAPGQIVCGGAFGGSGTTTINGEGWMDDAAAGSGTTTINNVGRNVLGTGNATINLSNSSYSQVQIKPGFGDSVINLSDPAAGVTEDAQPYATYAGGVGNNGQPIPVIKADANGNYSNSIDSYEDVLPTEGQAGYGQAHTLLDFRNFTADQQTSQLDGSTLTLTVAATGETLTINNYQPGRITFSFTDANGNLTASRTPPGLSAGS